MRVHCTEFNFPPAVCDCQRSAEQSPGEGQLRECGDQLLSSDQQHQDPGDCGVEIGEEKENNIRYKHTSTVHLHTCTLVVLITYMYTVPKSPYLRCE